MGFLVTLLIAKNNHNVSVPNVYMSSVFFQVGGGVLGSFLAFKKFSNFSKVPFIILIPISFLISTNLSLFFTGIGISLILNRFIYSGRVLASLLLGFIAPSLLLFATCAEILFNYDSDFIYTLSISFMAIIMLIRLPSMRGFNWQEVNISHIMLSVMFGITNLLVVFSYNNMDYVVAEKIYLAIFSASTLNYFRRNSVIEDFSFPKKILNARLISIIELPILLFVILSGFILDSYIPSLLLAFYFHAKASILFRVIQIKHLDVKYSFAILLILPLFYFAREYTMLAYWLFIYYLLKNSLSAGNL